MNNLLNFKDSKFINEYCSKIVNTAVDSFKGIKDDSEKSKVLRTGIRGFCTLAAIFVISKSGIECGKFKLGINNR